ncbi:6-phosphogluconolactonase [Robiginitalea sediminis]|uniref:6-phosphogluconolactonase n=1 Tax=Robiginitalea sediminis TaxID=1982593 RepID=UPI000B4B527E|nr:6-phosphogluconolactonase [Robiginitalea sediminis]
MEIRILNTQAGVAAHMARRFEGWCREESFRYLALSGGSTPKILFDHWAADASATVPWDRLEFFWGDERCVGPGDPESNYGMTRQHLFDHISADPSNIHRIRGEEDPQQEARRYEALIRDRLPKAWGMPRFDLVLLGMGDDGHTASVFPHQMSLWDSPRGCEVATHPVSGQQRITLTGGWINGARRIVFLVTGGAKAEKVKEILEGKGAEALYPAARVRPESGELIWLLDQEAASGLSPEFIAAHVATGPVLPGK